MADDAPLYARLLGPDWLLLPAITRALHQPEPEALFEGRADIRRGSNLLARLMASLLGLPEAGSAVETLVKVSRTDDGGELLERWYGHRHFATWQGARDGLLIERFGPFELRFRLSGHEAGIDFHQIGVSLWGLGLPRALAPQVRASERADGDVHCFDVSLSLPGVGLIVAYKGRLERAVD
jgi:hypothetical protein